MESIFSDFTSKLCSQEQLVDIAPLGTASQSSFSKWSQRDDAQRAVQGLSNVDFAFHTDKQSNPWWTLKFSSPVPVSYIILHNRRNPKYRALANSVRVSIQLEDDSWHDVHCEDTPFGAEPDSRPLVLPLARSSGVVTVRLALENDSYFHLSGVNVLAPTRWIAENRSKPIFIAPRTDGLGERLRAILNAIVAAEKCDGDFLVHWRSRTPGKAAFHAIIPAEAMFSSDFIGNHMLADEKLSAMKTASARKCGLAPGLGMPANIDGLILDQHGLIGQIPSLTGRLNAGDFSRAFERVTFHPALEKARKAAQTVELRGKPIAIHVRAGDIVYGIFRHTDRATSKVTPFPLVESLIRRAKDLGSEILIFGQDRDLCEYLADKYEVLLADSYGDELSFDEAQRALFEICLMARCGEIFSGNSGFAMVAGLMSGVNPKSADKVLRRGEMAEALYRSILETTDHRVSNMQVAYACLYAVAHFREELGSAAIGNLTDIAVRRDPSNSFLFLQRASHLYSIGDHQQAEAVLRSEIEKGGEFGIWRLLTERFPGGKVDATDYLPPIRAAADGGHAIAALCVAVERQSGGDVFAARRYFDAYLSAGTTPIHEWEARLNATSG